MLATPPSARAALLVADPAASLADAERVVEILLCRLLAPAERG